jgi:hypothetical protein
MSYEADIRVEDRLASLFEPDTLLEAQYYDTFRRKAHLEPEKRLMLGVLEDAVACFQKYVGARDGRGKAMFREAEEWIIEENSDGLFSFENICDVLGFNPEYVRQGLLRWKETKLAARPRAKGYCSTLSAARERLSVKMPGRTAQRLLKAAAY